MKKYCIALLLLSIAGSSCNTGKQGVKTEQNQTMTVTGTVKEIRNGKDGYTARIITSDNKTYMATISHSNLKDHTQYRAVKTGDVITVKGDTWMMEGATQITVRELK